METQKLDVGQTLKDGIILGLKNFFPLLLTIILYIITIWIPYVNVGTSIGISWLIIDMSKGKPVKPLSIFDKKNFSQIGDVFLLWAFMFFGITVAMIFLFVPALVLSMAWTFAMYVMLDKGKNANQSLSTSYSITFGEKWRIFFVELLLGLIICVACLIVCFIPKVGTALGMIVSLVGGAISSALNAVLYAHFEKKIEA